jgi:ketosteroid isomerase-like protein
MAKENEDLVMELLAAIERRDLDRILEIYHPEVEFHWPPPLPYGGTTKGAAQTISEEPSWQSTWLPLQPTANDRAMDARVIASCGDEVAVLYHQRGRDAQGNTYDGQVMGLYEVADRKLRRAQMFYYDTEALLDFLKRSNPDTGQSD